MIDAYKFKTEWEENHMVGVHVRRGDLTIYGKNVSSPSPFKAKETMFWAKTRRLVMERGLDNAYILQL